MRKLIRSMLLVMTIIALIVIVAAPFTEPYGTFTGLDGRVAVFDHSDLGDIGWFSSFAYTVGDWMCHQMESRSMILNGSQLPVCLRDMCILSGFAIGLGASFLTPERTVASRMFTYIASAFIALVLLDWGIQHFTSFDSTFTRCVTGMLAGIGLAIIVEKLVLRMYSNVFSETK